MIEMRMELDGSRIRVACSREGSVDRLLVELAAGLADVVAELAKGLQTQDDLSEMMLRDVYETAQEMLGTGIDEDTDRPTEA